MTTRRMTPAALLALALGVALGVPAVLLYRLVRSHVHAPGALRATVVVVACAVTVAPFLSVALRPLVDASFIGGALAPVVFAPVLEEIGKSTGIAAQSRARLTRRDALAFGAMAGLAFAIVENALYVYAEFVTAGPQLGLATALYRAVGPVALHLACSGIAGEAWWAIHQPERKRGAVLLLATAIGFHALANAVGPLGIAWPLVVDAAAAGFLLWRSSLSRKSPLAPA